MCGSQPTYEGLKLDEVGHLRAVVVGSQPTYEGLKPSTIPGIPRLVRVGSQPTYEGLKPLLGLRLLVTAVRSQPTYEGLKPLWLLREEGRRNVPSLPMRD